MALAAILSGSSVPPTSDVLCEALVIKGPYDYGPEPRLPDGSRNPSNRLFMDELEQLPWDQVMAALDQYQGDGFTSITLGPAFAIGYHGEYPNTSWLNDTSRIIRVMQECRRRGMRIVLVVLPDCAPYFDGNVWDWALVERDLTPIYSMPEFQSLVQDIQCEWEINAENAECCRAGQYCARVFPGVLRVYWHTPNGHSGCGRSSEPMTERQMWDNFADAIAAVSKKILPGWAMQDDSIYMQDLTREQQLENFANNVRVMMNHFPRIVKWAREYIAYAVYNWNWPVDGGPQNWGTVARENGSPNIGDGGPQ